MAAVMITPRNATRDADVTRPTLVRPARPRPAVRPSTATVRRRRVATVLIAVATVIVAGRATAGAVGGSPLVPPHRPASTADYTVRPGDSLWVAAEHVAPDSDPRDVVDALEAARGGAPLLPGERIVWPIR